MSIVFSQRIVSNPKVLGGKPIIKNTRMSVEFTLGLIRSGMSFADILKEYPHLKKSDLQAVVEFAQHAVSQEELIPFEALA